MHDDIDDGDDLLGGLPASMADTFLALVGVVIIMLLSLAPALRGNPALPPEAGSEAAASESAGGTLAFVAEADSLRVAGKEGTATPLAAILGSAALADTLRDAAAGGRGVLLLIEPHGQEAAFLFGALAHWAGIGRIRQVRLSGPCGETGIAAVARMCGGGPAGTER
jgi:hypothetical protein